MIYALNWIQIRESHKWLTAFNSRYDQFKYLVMPFRLCNAPRTFQKYINESLRKYFDIFYTAYLDDVFIYSIKEEDYADYVLQVLKRLYRQELQIDIDKCKFSTTKVKYLSMIVTTNGIEIDAEKVKAIQRWKTPSSMKKVQMFLRFANFYRQFILSFLKISQLLVDATKRSQYTTKFGNKKIRYESFKWIEAREKAFKDLKKAFTTALVLAHYNSFLET